MPHRAGRELRRDADGQHERRQIMQPVQLKQAGADADEDRGEREGAIRAARPSPACDGEHDSQDAEDQQIADRHLPHELEPEHFVARDFLVVQDVQHFRRARQTREPQTVGDKEQRRSVETFDRGRRSLAGSFHPLPEARGQRAAEKRQDTGADQRRLDRATRTERMGQDAGADCGGRACPDRPGPAVIHHMYPSRRSVSRPPPSASS
jgi:hypothetical protein